MSSPQSRRRRRRDRTAGAGTTPGTTPGITRGTEPRATPGTPKPGATPGTLKPRGGPDTSGRSQDKASNPPKTSGERSRDQGPRSPAQALPSGQVSSAPESLSTPRTAGRSVAAVVSGLQALALLGFCGFYAVGLARGESDSPARVVMSIILIAIFAVGLAALAVAWWRGAGWPGTPTAVWNALLLPVAWGLFQGGQGLIGGTVLMLALVGLLAALTSGLRRGPP